MTIAQAEETAEHPLEETAAWLSDVADDPLAFVEDAFPWGKGELSDFDGPMEWQRWVLEQIRDGLLTPGKAIQIAVASGHGIGKTALVCWITLWAMTTAGGTRGIITASTEAMLNNVRRSAQRRSPHPCDLRCGERDRSGDLGNGYASRHRPRRRGHLVRAGSSSP